MGDVFDVILPELAAECEWDMEKDADTINEPRAEFIESASSTDGYEIMRNLELRHAWSGNTRLVEVFDDTPFRKCLCEHVQKWLNYFKVEPLFKVGDVVTFQHGRENLSGVIESTEITFEPGAYLVCVAGMNGKSVVRWESCTKNVGST